ncbi:unnamed protein product [Prorocentrum cordatum]|uniref:Uncharacterized protein n=1 Tax=Prorocentrum cordatum TaxID=2364126 RepID=A0ABN9YB01_9DINO|nr:unnamed protein product [Polarella glacialis]
MAAVSLCQSVASIVCGQPSAAHVLAVALGAAAGGASRQTAAAMVSAAIRTSCDGVDGVQQEVAARLAMVEPALTELVKAGPTGEAEISGDMKAMRNAGLHVDMGCGADDLPQTGREAKRRQRGGRKAKESLKIDGSQCYKGADAGPAPPSEDKVKGGAGGEGWGPRPEEADLSETVDDMTDLASETVSSSEIGMALEEHVKCASDCKTIDTKGMVSVMSYGDALDEVDDTQYLPKPVAEQIGEETLEDIDLVPSGTATEGKVLVADISNGDTEGEDDLGLRKAKHEWELQRASVFAGVSNEELYETFLDWRDQHKSINMEELVKSGLALAEFSRKLKEWEDNFKVEVWGAT